MSGITLYAKDFVNSPLDFFGLILLKTIYNKERDIWEALKKKVVYFNATITTMAEEGFIKVLSNDMDISIDDVVLRGSTAELFKDEESKATEVLEYLNKVITKDNPNKRGFSPKPSANKKFINARLGEGYTVEDMKKVIDTMYKEWSNTKYDIYLRPETLFNPTKFAGYLVRADKAPKITVTSEML